MTSKSTVAELKARFNALPSEAQDAILEKHRDWNIGFDWWEDVYEQFKESMTAKGVQVDNIYFSGFWCQGDGACFEGSVADWSKFFAAHFPDTFTELKAYWPLMWNTEFSCKSTGHYYHSKSVRYTECFESQGNPYDENEQRLRFLAEQIRIEEMDKAHAQLHEAVETLFEGYMDQLYRDLEKEHEYLTSDEAVLEALLENDMLEDEINQATKDEDDEYDDAHPGESPLQLPIRLDADQPSESPEMGPVHPHAGRQMAAGATC